MKNQRQNELNEPFRMKVIVLLNSYWKFFPPYVSICNVVIIRHTCLGGVCGGMCVGMWVCACVLM